MHKGSVGEGVMVYLPVGWICTLGQLTTSFEAMDPNVKQFTKVEHIIKDAVRCYCVIWRKKWNKLFKQSSAYSSSRKHLLPQPKNMILICTVTLKKHYCI
jgi:hypothetical protein